MNIDIRIGNEPSIPLERLKRVISDLEILATVEIKQDERVREMLEDPTVKKRTIYVFDTSDSISDVFEYSVEDYAFDGNEEVLVGEGEYNSDELSKPSS